MKVFVQLAPNVSTLNYLVLSRAEQQSCDLVILILCETMHWGLLQKVLVFGLYKDLREGRLQVLR